MEHTMPLDKTKDMTLDSGVHVTIHYSAGSESLSDKMILILQRHMENSGKI